MTLALTLVTATSSLAGVRLKDVVSFEGVRSNHLIGYGLVVGLSGTGDKLAASPFTRESIKGMLERMGVANLDAASLKTKNTAAVVVTAKLPPFARRGSTMGVTVSSLGDARSLRGGTLLVTTLSGADGEVYAVAQGAVVTAGFLAEGAATSVQEGVPTIARIENGAIIEREVEFDLNQMSSIRIALNSPDFTTAMRVKEAIAVVLGPQNIKVLDPGTVEVTFVEKGGVPELIAAIENVEITPDTVAKVIVDEKTGTIVMGANVRISQVAISQGGLTVKVTERLNVSQPGPSSIGGSTFVMTGEPVNIGGTTVVVPETEIKIDEQDRRFTVLEGDVSLQELVNGLNAIGVSARQTISILQAIKAAGALHASLEII